MNRDQIKAWVAGFAPELNSPYTAEELAEVFDLYLHKFRLFTGREHPELKREQLRALAVIVPYFSASTSDPRLMSGEACEILPEQYGRIMDNYFASKYKGCNYHIHHFFAGQIRRNAAERAGIVRRGETPVHIRGNIPA